MLSFRGRHAIKLSKYRKLNFCSNVIEKWRNIPDYDKYQVSSFGNFRNIRNQRIRFVNYKSFRERGRRAHITLMTNDNARKTSFVHRLVLSSFHPIQNDALEVNHIDGDPYNNVLENLNWMTRKENMRHAATLGKFGKGVPIQIIHKHSNKPLEFQTMRKCQEYLNRIGKIISSSYISYLCQNQKCWNDIGFKYLDESRYIFTIQPEKNEYWRYYQTGKQFQQYYVSNHGRIKCVRKQKEKLMSQSIQNSGYYSAYVRSAEAVHRVVAKLFVNNPNDYNMVDHVDGDCWNNHASNLRWIKNCAENMSNTNTKNKIRTTKSLQNKQRYFPISQFNKYNLVTIKEWDCQQQLISAGYDLRKILSCIQENSHSRTAYGYVWTPRGQKPKSVKLTEILQLSKEDPTKVIHEWTQKELQSDGWHVSNIIRCCNNRVGSSQGFKWKYAYNRES